MTPTLMVKSGKLDLAVYRWGAPASATRPTVVLVHGYPDSASVWEAVAAKLSEHCHVVAYDVRGAGNSSVPAAVRDYDIAELVGDLDAVVTAVSPDRPVHLACHDWGSIALWEAVTTPRMRDRIVSYTSMSGPSFDHAGMWLRQRMKGGALGTVARQFGRSWYMGAFQLPLLAPLLWKSGFAKQWPGYLKRTEGTVVAPSATQVKDGANGVNLYRANLRKRLLSPQERRTETPVQLIVARRDPYMLREIFDDLPQWAPNLWRRDLDAGHWMPLSHPQEIAAFIAEFVAFTAGGVETQALRRARVRRGGGRHAGKLVIVTGAGSGFGRETLLLFAEHGADVIAADIDLAAAERSAELARLLGAQAFARKVDVGSAAEMEAFAAWTKAELGAPDIVVNNAGIGMAGAFLDTSVADWEKVLRVNLWGVIHGARLFGRQMVAAGKRGHIVNVASAAAFTPSRSLSAYATTKAAVRMLSDCMRAELADQKVRVSTICPGFSNTGITQTAAFVGVSAEEQARRRERATRLYQRRNLKPQTIASAILSAVENNKDEVPVGIEAHATRLISRYLPTLARRIARVDLANSGE